MPIWTVKDLKEELDARNYKDDEMLLLTFWDETFIREYTECTEDEFNEVIYAGDDAMDGAIAIINDAMIEALEEIREAEEKD